MTNVTSAARLEDAQQIVHVRMRDRFKLSDHRCTFLEDTDHFRGTSDLEEDEDNVKGTSGPFRT